MTKKEKAQVKEVAANLAIVIIGGPAAGLAMFCSLLGCMAVVRYVVGLFLGGE